MTKHTSRQKLQQQYMSPQRVISPWPEVEAIEEHGGDGQGDQGEHHQGGGAQHTGIWDNNFKLRIINNNTKNVVIPVYLQGTKYCPRVIVVTQ